MIRIPCPRIAPACSFTAEGPMYHVAVLELAEHLAGHMPAERASGAILLALLAPYEEEPYWQPTGSHV